MLRINLLPAYVAQRRKTKKAIAFNIAGFAVVVAAMLAYEFVVLKPEDASETTLANAAVAAKSYIDQETQLATSTLAGAATVQGNIAFFHAVQSYNSQYPNLYETVARFTSPRILYTGMSVSGTTMTIDAYTPSIEELGRYLQVMYHEPDMTSVSISSIPTPDQAAQKIYYYKGRVIGISGGATATSKSAIPGVPAGVSVTLPAGVKLPGGGPVATNNTPPGLPAMAPNNQYQIQQPGGQPGAQAASGVYGTILADPEFDPRYFKVVTRKTDGFAFVATCALKQAFTPPTVPAQGGGSAAPTAAAGPGNAGG